MITAVTFDFWNTIARLPPEAMDEARQRAVTAACEECEVEIEAARLAASLEAVESQYRRSWAEGRHFHPDEGAEMLVRTLEIEDVARELAAEAFLKAGRNADLVPAPDIAPCLEALRERGIRLGIVCDVVFTGGELLRELLERKGLFEYFSGWGFSDEVGCFKPAPQIFEAALGSLGAQPAETVHVGDLRRTDVTGASRLGMRTVRYRGMHDDPKVEGEAEAEFVIDNHLELVDIVER
jgi:HAD superfamily hydrolase (TIGR01509 family)